MSFLNILPWALQNIPSIFTHQFLLKVEKQEMELFYMKGEIFLVTEHT